MTHPAIQSLQEQPNVHHITAATLDSFLGAKGGRLSALFFTGDPEKKLETPDVAVVLRELLGMANGHLQVGIVAREDEQALMGRAAVLMLPSIAFFDGSELLETAQKIQDWDVYVALMDKMFKATGLAEVV